MKNLNCISSILYFFLFQLILMPARAQPGYPSDPTNAELIFTDVENFVLAYNRLEPGVDTIAILKEFYFDQATPGLVEFCSRFDLDALAIKEAIHSDPEVYAGVESYLHKHKTRILTDFTVEMQRYHTVVTDAIYPPTYLLIGSNRGIAQASKEGQLIDLIRRMDDFEKLFDTVIHELTHFQQARLSGFGRYASTYSKENNMLELVIREGCAQFVTYVLVRNNRDTYRQLQYLEAHQEELIHKFQDDLNNQDASFWMWDSLNSNSKTPKLLGYAMGFLICEKYYDMQDDKNQALIELLKHENPQMMLSQSKLINDTNSK